MNTIQIDYRLRKEFWDWCEQHGCQPEHQRSTMPWWDIWFIPDDKVFLLAVLRWS